jgi:2-polyprenyl-3-methyl-5-hydroxy-6-metoxy-1,4-benzoquinol methylase
MNIFKRAALKVYSSIGREVCRREYLNQQSIELNERAVEYSFALRCVWRTSAHTVLDVGSGYSPWPSLLSKCGCTVTAIDSMEGYWHSSIFNRHFHVIKDDITKPKLSENFDLITCISTLEHIHNHQDAIRGMFSLLKPDGYLVLTFPYNESRYVENVYQLPGAGYGQDKPYICQVFSRQEVNLWLEENQGKIVEQQYFEMFQGPLWTFGGHISPPRKVSVTDKHDLTLILIQRT